ncbi:ferritin-like domain-containing protein [Streptosporangium sp. KLBMP 9127]|nr:ferritin-like domain-containing protein [Streptosporangium sp. KLBMP 9127]
MSATTTVSARDALLAALLKALAAEHAAVYAYSLGAARVEGRQRSLLTAAHAAHRNRRDQLRTLINGRGGTPVEAEPSYTLPLRPGTSAEAVRLATLVEEGVTAVYLELVAVDDGPVRRLAALAMQESVTRSYGLRPEITALPGLRPATPSPAPATPTTQATPADAPASAAPGG